MVKSIVIKGLRYGVGRYTIKHDGQKDSILMRISSPGNLREVEVYFQSGEGGEPLLLKKFTNPDTMEGVDAYMWEAAKNHAQANQYLDLSGVYGPKIKDKSRRGREEKRQQSRLEAKTTAVHMPPRV